MTTVYDAVLASITPQLNDALAASRARPFAPSPSTEEAEPRHAEQLFRRLAEETCASLAPEEVPVMGTGGAPHTLAEPFDPVGASVEDLLVAYSSGVTTPTAVFEVLAGLWTSDETWTDAVLRLVPGGREAAADSTRRWVEGAARPLEGVPFAVKDIIDVEGVVVTCGSLQTGDRIAPADATIVARLRAAGAIPAFMAATTEFACGGPSSARYGAVRNPWDAERWTGGSSTGSAAALAARIIPLALGSDTGGSIRVPAALSGVTGVKPTYGLVPRTGVASLSWTLDHVGPMARSARELALVLPLVAGPDGIDPTVPDAVPSVVATGEGVRGLRIGTPSVWFTERVDSAVMAAYREAMATFEGLGAELVEVEFDGLAEAHDECWNIFYGELASNQEANSSAPELFDDGTRARLALSFTPTAADYLRALRRRPVLQRHMLARMDDARVDLLLIPGIGATAPRLDDLTMAVDGERFNLHDVIPRNTRLFDYTGFPALMMPAGLAPDGLPVGVQLVGRPWHDALCLNAAIAFQDVTGHHRLTPGGSACSGLAGSADGAGHS
jgi:aspartyl-tRNA(Asn)/glutamyl-tRNA(Gln) amidotransferase subunit A